MWEKIVLNLLPNAFKFTLEGSITVRIRQDAKHVVLEVADTGIGVPTEEIPRLFERFYRVEGTRGRTHEGSGIGLALVQQLVELHGATIEVDSELQRGTTFRIVVPAGSEHLPADRVRAPRAPASPAVSAQAFVQEARRWLPDTAGETYSKLPALIDNVNSALDQRFASTFGARIVLADDNADMRAYVRDLLAPYYAVELVADGEQALAAACRERPDLILCDVMMPLLDGFGVLAAVRADEALCSIPVVLLSARADEESRIEGLDAGADDYLTKPFSARELVARVGALLELEKMRRGAEEALRHRTEQFQTLLNAAPLGVYLIDADFRIREVNPTAQPVFGDIPDLIGRDFDEVVHILFPTARADELVRRFRHTLETGEPFAAPELIEERLDRGVVEYYEWQINRIPLPEGRAGVVCYFRDISAQIHARRALIQQRQELQTMLEVIPVGVAIAHDPLGSEISVTPTFAALLGLAPTQNASLTGPDSARIPYRCAQDGRTISAEELPMQRAARTGKDVRNAEFDLELADGRVLNMMVNAAPLFDADGKVRGAIGAHVDVTALKRVQRRLEAADRQKDEFLAMLAHELRNPLAPIRNAGEILSRASPAESRALAAINIIQRQVTHLTRLVDDLLDVSRITQGRIDLKVGPLQLGDIVAHAVETVEPLFKEKRHRVTIQSSYQPLSVSGDSARLVQSVANILTNAAKYTDADGDIQIESHAEGAEAVLTVTDNGVGISQELLPRVFDLFVQGDRTLDRAQGGLGIGLSVVKRLIEMHHGRVVAASAGLGQGSRLEIRLPLLDRAARSVAEERSRPIPPRRILAVDDNQDAANSLTMVLSLDGHEVETAYTGQQALERVQSFRPDVVLLDIGLPEMDGYEVARRIRSQPDLDGVCLVALTGYGQPEDKQRAKAAGFDTHLIKPIDFAALRRVLANLRTQVL
jgi:PAS domain S-box-containing protein